MSTSKLHSISIIGHTTVASLLLKMIVINTNIFNANVMCPLVLTNFIAMGFN